MIYQAKMFWQYKKQWIFKNNYKKQKDYRFQQETSFIKSSGMSSQQQNNINWYSNVYYSYQDYPIKNLNIKYKKNELKDVYNTLMKKMLTNLEININNQCDADDNNDQHLTFEPKSKKNFRNKLSQAERSSESNKHKSVNLDKDFLNQISISSRKHKTPQNLENSMHHESQLPSSCRTSSVVDFSDQGSISSMKNIHNSKQRISQLRQSSQSPNSTNKIQLNLQQKYEETISSQTQNMDVFYELMIGMIRLTIKRITVEIDQELKQAKKNSKKFYIINEEIERSQNEDNSDSQSSFNTISQQSKSAYERQNDSKSSSDFNSTSKDYNFLMKYASSFENQERKNPNYEKLRNREKKTKDDKNIEVPLTDLEYPSNAQEIKFQFLKYCLTSNVSYDTQQFTNNRVSQQFRKSFQNNDWTYSEVEKESKQKSSQTAKIRLQTYFTQITGIDTKKTKEINQKESISEIEMFVMRFVSFGMKSFNLFVNHFFRKIEQTSAIANVIGIDDITEYMYQMTLRKQTRNNGIKTQAGLGSMQTKLFSNSVDQQDSNILLTTWVDLVLFAQDPKIFYDIIQNLNRQPKNGQINSENKKTWTPSMCSTPASLSDSSQKQTDKIVFKEKMLSLLNFLILNTTKGIFLQSITKANFLSVVMMQILANRHDYRSLREFELRPLKDSQMGQQRQKQIKYFVNQDQAFIVYDLTFQKQVWLKQSLDLIFSKWRKVMEIIFQQQVKNQQIYWQLIFQKCVSLINRQLSLLTVLVFNLLEIIENVNNQVNKINQNDKITQFDKRQLAKCEQVKGCLQSMIKQMIGCSQIFGIDETQVRGEQNFVNREENAKELVVWEKIVKENILILENYILIIELITLLFDKKTYHTATWVINFHKQAKSLLRKVKKENLPMFFLKFYSEIPKLWSNLNSQENQSQAVILLPMRRTGFIATKDRLSSIKKRKQMTLIEKEALIMNYLIKAQLELYESYTKSYVLNCREQSSTMTTIVSGNSILKSSWPFIMQDPIIQQLLLFSYKDLGKQKRIILSNELFAKRRQKTNLTLKPLSSSGNCILQPPKSYKGLIEGFEKGSDAGFNSSKLKQEQRRGMTEFQIDVSTLSTISYTREQIQLLSQLNKHIQLINEINFQYEYYQWKNVSYEKKIKAKSKENNIEIYSSKNGDEQKSGKKSETYEYNEKKFNFSSKKMFTYHQYTLEKIKSLLATEELFQQFIEINQAILGTRYCESNHSNCRQKVPQKLPHYHNIDTDNKDEGKKLYLQKIQLLSQRLKIHNNSLILILIAALQAKNYWKTVSLNISPDDKVLNVDNKQYITQNQSINQKISENQIKTIFREKYISKKILQKYEEYIGYYKQISKQLNHRGDTGEITPEIIEKLGENLIQSQIQFQNQKRKELSEKLKILKPRISADEQSLQKSNKMSQIKIVLNEQVIEENDIPKDQFNQLFQAIACKIQQPARNRLQIAASIYQCSQKILQLNCYMASFFVERRIYQDIINQEQLSQQKLIKSKIIGKKYFEKIKEYQTQTYIDKQITEENLKNLELIYEKKVLIMMISLLQLIYYGNQHTKTVIGKWKYESRSNKQRMGSIYDVKQRQFERGYKNHGFKIRKSTIKKYSQILRRYLKHRLKNNTNQIFFKQGLGNSEQQNPIDEGSKSDFCFISKLFSEIFELGEIIEEFTQQKFISLMIKLRKEEKDEEFLKFFIQIMQRQNRILSQFSTELQKVNFLKKKYSYLILRQAYFFLQYNIDCLQEKSTYSKKNYEIYQNSILQFYQEIINKNKHIFTRNIKNQLNKHSAYLQDNMISCENEPQITDIQKILNKLIISILNQIMLIYTQDIKKEIKNKSGQVGLLNHQVKRNITQSLHTQYLSCEFYEDKSLLKRKTDAQEQKLSQRKPTNEANLIFPTNHGISLTQNKQSVNIKLPEKFLTGQNNQRDSKYYSNNQGSSQSNNPFQNKDSNTSSTNNKNDKTFKVFTIENMYLHESFNIYQEIKLKNQQSVQKYFTDLKQAFVNIRSLRHDDLTEQQIKTLETNEESIVSLLKRQKIEKINQLKFHLAHKNLISRIQKLYIDLDVRHKVFESFKNQILSYEMQKNKIYHQQMDYIRGLKLDVYSHIANQQSLSYIKILNALKFYRLKVKKEELEDRVKQEIGNNLKKWNQGIQEDLSNYNQWLHYEYDQWEKAKLKVVEEKNHLLLIYDSIKKQLKRQSKKKQTEEKRKVTSSLKSFKNRIGTTFTDHKKFKKPIKQLKKVGISKKNLFMAQKPFLESHLQLANENLSNQITRNKIPKDQKEEESNTLSQSPQILFMVAKNDSNKRSLLRGKSLHNLNNRSLQKHLSSQKKKERPMTSMHNQNRLSFNTTKAKSRDFNRASTAVTRQKSVDLQASQFRGIKMKYNSKSIQKFAKNESTCKEEQNNFKKRTYFAPGYEERIFSGHVSSKNNYTVTNNFNKQSSQQKSRSFKNEARCIHSAIGERKGIMKEF